MREQLKEAKRHLAGVQLDRLSEQQQMTNRLREETRAREAEAGQAQRLLAAQAAEAERAVTARDAQWQNVLADASEREAQCRDALERERLECSASLAAANTRIEDLRLQLQADQWQSVQLQQEIVRLQALVGSQAAAHR